MTKINRGLSKSHRHLECTGGTCLGNDGIVGSGSNIHFNDIETIPPILFPL
jgi:hypothetical protein